MFKMWYLAESDLLRPNNRYTLSNTGQGLNRVQQVCLPDAACSPHPHVESNKESVLSLMMSCRPWQSHRP